VTRQACPYNVVDISGSKRDEYRLLINGLQNKDPSAPLKLYNIFAKKIDRRVWRMLGPDAEHEDLVQHIFAQIFAKIHQLKNSDTLESWITSITINTVKKELRRRSYRKILLFKPVIDLADDTRSFFDLPEEDEILQRHTFAVLDRMPAVYRIIFIMKFFDENTNIEISRALGCSLATVKRKIIKSRNMFVEKAMDDFFLASLITEGRI
jgi:RNA polymerase sigma-70 factor (ECF subfamily)